MRESKCPLGESSLSAQVLCEKNAQTGQGVPAVPQNVGLKRGCDDRERALGWSNDDGTSSFLLVHPFC